MIKSFNEYIKESLLNKLTGPTIEEILVNNPNVAFEISVKTNDEELLKKSFENGADVNKSDLFVDLIHYNNFTWVKKIVELGVNYKKNTRSFIEAIRIPNFEMVKYLVENCDVDYELLNKLSIVANAWIRNPGDKIDKIEEFKKIQKYLYDKLFNLPF